MWASRVIIFSLVPACSAHSGHEPWASTAEKVACGLGQVLKMVMLDWFEQDQYSLVVWEMGWMVQRRSRMCRQPANM
jgi:hypothetical protein